MKLKISIFQKNVKVGDIKNNFDSIKESYLKSIKLEADLFLTPELCLSGYPPKDLLLRKDFLKENLFFVSKIKKISKNKKTIIALGVPTLEKNKVFNSILLIADGKIIQKIDKKILPNYGVFDEKRYFTPGEQDKSYLKLKDKKIKFLICEDFWNDELVNKVRKNSFDLVIVTNASPFEKEKYENRMKLTKRRLKEFNSPIIYLNLVGAQDDLVFDGGSFCMNKNKKIIFHAPFFREFDGKFTLDFEKNNPIQKVRYSKDKNIYEALVIGFRDYILKNKFSNAIIGISGGIDSALATAIACDSIGSDNIKGYFLPSCYTSKESEVDARNLAERCKIKMSTISIESLREKYEKTLCNLFKGLDKDITEENIQSRIRGTLLMAMSNKFNSILISTGNKSELAVGYSTIYGDMCGGFSILKDLYKTEVNELCDWRNNYYSEICLNPEIKIIPENILKKEPTAELKENQRDSDSLPPYKTLDKILYFLIEKNLSLEQIESKGFKRNLIKNIWDLIKKSEYKRYQSPPGTKLSSMSFDLDRRFPIINKFNLN